MSHYCVLVIGDNPEFQLEPFDENLEVERYCVGVVSDKYKEDMLSYYKDKGFDFKSFDECYKAKGKEWDDNRCAFEDGEWSEYSTYNPDSRWDWYMLGGRWTGEFIKLKSGSQGVVGEASWATGHAAGVDQAYKKDIDFDAIKSCARTKALATYRDCANKCGGQIPLLHIHWEELCHSDKYSHMSLDEKREIYHAQESIKIWEDKVIGNNSFVYALEDFQCSEEEYANRVVRDSFIPYAVLYEGEWIARGDMGWWGIATNEHFSEDDWCEKVWGLIDECSDDTLFSFYDLHI